MYTKVEIVIIIGLHIVRTKTVVENVGTLLFSVESVDGDKVAFSYSQV